MFLGIGQYGHRFSYSFWYVGIPIILFFSFASWQAWNIYPDLPFKQKLFYLFTTITILLLPLGDLFIIIFIPALILYFFIVSPKKLLTDDKISLIWLLFIFVALIGSFFAEYSKASAFAMLIALLGYGFLFNIGRSIDFPKEYTEFYTTIFCGIVPITICFGIFHLFLGRNLFLLGIFIPSHGSPGLASLLSEWPANVAGFLVIAFVIVFGLFLNASNNKQPFKSIIFSIVLLIIFIGLLLTENRGVFLFFIGMGLLFLIFYPWQVFRKIRFFILLIPFLLMPLLTQYSDKWKDTLENPLQQYTIADRINQIQFGFSLLKDKVLWHGIGLFNFRFAYKYYLEKSKSKLPEVEFLHNVYLSVLVETGILGFILFMIALLYLFTQYAKYRHQLPAYTAMLFLGGLAFYNITDNWLYILKFSILLFLFLGYCYPNIHKEK
ncbi:O-antigen ligase family protein [Brevinema andersonii]|nr:O-antigen ligase family protein [Brevinema andersonii]